MAIQLAQFGSDEKRVYQFEASTVVVRVAGLPVPGFLIEQPGDLWTRKRALDTALTYLAEDVMAAGTSGNDGWTSRCVHASCLPAVLQRGVDVEPTNSLIFVDWFDKSLEYGTVDSAAAGPDGDQLGMVLAREGLHSACVRVRKDTAPDELERLRQRYCSEFAMDDDFIGFACVSAEEVRQRRSYIWDYGAFIPGDPWKALRMLVLIGDDMGRLAKRVLEAVGQEPR